MRDGTGSIGFIGLGNMGAPMVRRLLDAGYDVTGYDVAPQARERVAALGAVIAPSAAEAATDVSMLILMLPNSDVVEAVLDDELLGAMDPGTLVVDMSSSEPARTQALAVALAGRGLRMIDAPVSGGVGGAEAGTLTIMIGATEAELDEARPALETMGRVVLAGPVGSGHAVKSLNNLLSAAHLLVTSEAMIAGQRFGLDPEVMLSIFNGSSGRSGSTENKWPNFILPGTFNSGFGLRLLVKDMKIAVQLAEQVGAPSVLGAEAVALWSDAAAALPEAADHTEIARWLADKVAGDA